MSDQKFTALIRTAIKREEAANHFYSNLADKVDDAATRDTLLWIADEENKHKAFLEDYRDGKLTREQLQLSETVYYQIAEYQNEPEEKENMSRQEVFLLAAHREMKSHKFYLKLADLHAQVDVKEMLVKIANEELKHKEKMEYLYSNTAFPQTHGG